MKIIPKVYDDILCRNRNLKHKLFSILRSKEDLILKVSQLMKCYTKTFSLEKNMLKMYNNYVLVSRLVLVNRLKYNQCIQGTFCK